MATHASAGHEHIGGTAGIQRESTWLAPSIVAGVAAGIVMAMFAMVVAALTDHGLWAPPRAITALVFGTQNAGIGFATGPVVAGMMVHMMLSGMFGVGYALVIGFTTSRLALGVQALIGMMLGVALWAVNTYVLAGFLNGREVFTSAMPVWAWFAGHVMFGVALGLLYGSWRHGNTALKG